MFFVFLFCFECVLCVRHIIIIIIIIIITIINLFPIRNILHVKQNITGIGTSTRVHDQSDELLLQWSARQRAVNLDRQASTSPQRSCACDYQHSEVWPRVDEHSTRRPPLVGSATACVIQDLCNGVQSLQGMAPKYLAELYRPISDVQGRRHLRSAARGLLLTPRYYPSTYGRRAFSYAGPSAWNSLPKHLRAPDLRLNNFRHLLKTFLFTQMTHAAH